VLEELDGINYRNNSCSLVAVDIKTGKEKWKFESGDGVYSSPAVSDGVVYFGSGYHLYAVDIK
jgi:outer membrane protein assembly factor BamB